MNAAVNVCAKEGVTKENEHLDLVCRVIVDNKDSDKSNEYMKSSRKSRMNSWNE